MPSYQLYCNDCDTECALMTFEDLNQSPAFCSFCGNELDESNVREDTGDDEDEWDRLSEESLGELDDWKE